MSIKKLFLAIILVASLFLCSCNPFAYILGYIFIDKEYGEVEIGDCFNHSIDGHLMKLPKSYCLYVLIGEETSLFKMPEENYFKEFEPYDYSDKYLLSGRYIKGIYNDDFLGLCEETKAGEYNWLSFCFETQDISYYETQLELEEALSPVNEEWFHLCNILEGGLAEL